MEQVLIYADSLTWGIIPNTRKRLPFEQRWPGVFEYALVQAGKKIRIIENCLNGRRTVWSDPIKPGRDGSEGLAQVIEMHAPPAITQPKGAIADKFRDAQMRFNGFPEELAKVAAESSTRFFDAGKVTESSQVDGIHLDQPQHRVLGNALADFVLENRLV